MAGPTRARRRAVITGAGGGMGRACARVFGETMDLVLTDSAEAALEAVATSLADEGFTVVAALPGDLCDAPVRARLADAAAGGAGLGVLIHAAGLSPVQSGWDAILRVNLLATAGLLDAMEPLLTERAVAILIASIAGHLSPVLAEADAILDDPLAPDTMARIAPIIAALADPADPRGREQVSYALSKRAVLRLCERRAPAWAREGARINSISPGTIWTPMGRREAAGNPGAARVVEMTPAKRWGTAMDIAAAARFLASDEAAFITGTDLRVDGGVTPVLRQARAGR